MGGAGGGAGALIPERPGASEEAPGGVPVNREGRNVKYNCGVLQGTEHRYTHTHTHAHTHMHKHIHTHALLQYGVILTPIAKDVTVTPFLYCDSHTDVSINTVVVTISD